MKSKLIKNKCEITGCNESFEDSLHLHHIIEKTKIESSNNIWNLAILCANHHEYVHSGRLIIFGVIPSTTPPNNRILIYELDGVKNLDIEIPTFKLKNKSMKIY